MLPLQRSLDLVRRIGAWASASLVLAYFLFALIILVLRYGILPHIDHYRPQLEEFASHALKERVTIAAVKADWEGLRPRLTLSDIVVHDRSDRSAFHLPEVQATLAWETLTVFSPRFHRLAIRDADLDIRRESNGQLTVGGIPIDQNDESEGEGILPWVLAQSEIAITHARVHWSDGLRGAPQLDLDNLNFDLLRSGIVHRFALSAEPPAVLAAPLDVRGYIERDLFARTGDPAHWSGAVYANFAFVDLAGWHAYFDYPFQVTQGAGALRTWVHFSDSARHGGREGRLFDVVADVRMTHLEARTERDLPPLSLADVNGRIALEQTANGDHLTLHGFSLLGQDGMKLPVTELDARRTLDLEGQTIESSLTTSHLDLGTLAQLAVRLPFPSDIQSVLAQFKPRGLLSEVQMSWKGALADPKSYHFGTKFEGLTIAAANPNGTELGRPGFENLTGEISADQTGGAVSVHAKEAALTVPGLFAEPRVPFDKIELIAKWTRSGENVEVHLSTLEFENVDAAGTASGTYRRGPASTSKGPGYLDVAARLSRADARRVARYLPLSMPEDVRSYVDRAILAGTSDDVSFRVRGALERFPFRQSAPALAQNRTPTTALAHLANSAIDAPEDFRIAAKLHGIKLDFAPRPVSQGPSAEPLWPPMEDLEAELVLERTHLEITGKSARAYGFKLEKLHGDIPDLDDHGQILSIQGSGQGPLADLVRFVNASPVAGWIDHLTATARATGNARLELTLGLPLAHIDDAKAQGSIQFQNNDISLFAWLPPLARATGQLSFSDEGMSLTDASAQFLGGPVKLEASTAEDHFIQLRAEGTLQAQALRHEPTLPGVAKLAERLDGVAPYKFTLNAAPRSADERAVQAHGPRVIVESSLIGMSVDLPSPLKKAAADSLPLRVEFDPSRTLRDEVTDQVRARIGPQISLIFARRENASGEMDVVHAGYGINQPAVLTEARAYANVNLPALDLDAWQSVLGSLVGVNLGAALNTPTGAESVLLPDSISARVQSLHVTDKTFGNVVLNANHIGPTWQANVSSDEVSGQISWRQGVPADPSQNRITAHLTKLLVPRSATKEVTTLLEEGPTSLPALDITADDFQLRERKLGKLELLASNSTRAGHREWRLEKLNLSNPDGSFEAKGTWGADTDTPGNVERTHMELTVGASDIGGLMDRLGLKGTVKGGTATLKGNVSWRGSPLAIDYDSLSGDLSLRASRGQFLKAEPGVAKLLGVLSLQSLTRRLTLDFTDMFAGGFAFDSIDADAKVEDGVASTHNFSMRGVSANVSIDGSADLAHETQNLHVRVLPQVNLGTGSIAYALLVNPVIGLGTLAIGEVLRDPLSKALAFEYNVSGPWDDPAIVRVERTGAFPGTPVLPASPAVRPAVPDEETPAQPLPAGKPATSG